MPSTYTISGSVQFYNEAGLIRHFYTTINGETRCFVLASVRDEKPADCATGTSGQLAVSIDEENLVTPSANCATVNGSLSDEGSIPSFDWIFVTLYWFQGGK